MNGSNDGTEKGGGDENKNDNENGIEMGNLKMREDLFYGNSEEKKNGVRSFSEM